MPELALLNMEGKEVGKVELSEDVFGAPVNDTLVHQAVIRQLANMRRGTHCTKTRGEVRGGGRKPWRQKGTGRARHGSIRSPLWKGGGVTFGPRPRDYSQKMPKKMRRLAICGVISDKFREGKIVAMDKIGFDVPKTKGFVKMLGNLSLPENVLFIVDAIDLNLKKSASNLKGVKVITPDVLNVIDIVKYDRLVMTQGAINRVEEVLA